MQHRQADERVWRPVRKTRTLHRLTLKDADIGSQPLPASDLHCLLEITADPKKPRDLVCFLHPVAFEAEKDNNNNTASDTAMHDADADAPDDDDAVQRPQRGLSVLTPVPSPKMRRPNPRASAVHAILTPARKKALVKNAPLQGPVLSRSEVKAAELRKRRADKKAADEADRKFKSWLDSGSALAAKLNLVTRTTAKGSAAAAEDGEAAPDGSHVVGIGTELAITVDDHRQDDEDEDAKDQKEARIKLLKKAKAAASSEDDDEEDGDTAENGGAELEAKDAVALEDVSVEDEKTTDQEIALVIEKGKRKRKGKSTPAAASASGASASVAAASVPRAKAKVKPVAVTSTATTESLKASIVIAEDKEPEAERRYKRPPKIIRPASAAH